MAVKSTDNPAKRFIELEVEVPGTPEQVWQAIATGPGWSAWFTATDIEEREGGKIAMDWGGGIETGGTVTAWEPPHHFAAEERSGIPGAPAIATEIFVEAKSGGVCVVRLVNSLFTDATDWDNQLEGLEKGWPTFLHILRIYLEEFRGQPSAQVRTIGFGSDSQVETWAALAGGLGLGGATLGERRPASGEGVPPLAGVVVRATDKLLLLKLDEPAPGVAMIAAEPCGGPAVQTFATLYLYGEGAGAVAAREQPAWEAWMKERFPMPVEAGATTA